MVRGHLPPILFYDLIDHICFLVDLVYVVLDDAVFASTVEVLYYDQKLPDTDPEGLARTVGEVFNQYGVEGVENQLVDLGEWYE